MNVKKLTASDFPGNDEAKFNEWKALYLKTTNEFTIGVVLALAMLPFSKLLFGAESYLSTLPVFFMLAVFAFYFVRSKRVRQLKKELKMSDRLRAKKEGRVFNE